MLQPNGAVNVLLRNVGLIGADASLPFFTNPTWARVTIIVINIWVGVSLHPASADRRPSEYSGGFIRGGKSGWREFLPDFL